MTIHYTFPADCDARFNDVALAGMQCSGGKIASISTKNSKRLVVEFLDTYVGPTPRATARLVIPADTTPELFALAKAEALRDFAVSQTHGIAFPVDAVIRETGEEIRFGRIVDSDFTFPCSLACERQVMPEMLSQVFAVVNHPEFGVMGVSPVEFYALGLDEVDPTIQPVVEENPSP
jgi:hypothetical protein